MHWAIFWSAWRLNCRGSVSSGWRLPGRTHRIEEVVQGILAHRLQLVLGLVARLRAVVVMAAFPRAGTLRPLGLALEDAAVAGGADGAGGGISVRRTAAGMCALGREGFGYALLRHDGSIDGGATGSNGLRAQRAGGGRVHKAGIAGVADAMYNGGLAVVGVRLRGLALDATVRARAAAGGDDDGGGLRARREGAGGGSQRSPACYRRLAGGERGARGGFYMVQRVPSKRAWGGSSCSVVAVSKADDGHGKHKGDVQTSSGSTRQRTRCRRRKHKSQNQNEVVSRPFGPFDARPETGRGNANSHMPPACSGSSLGCAEGSAAGAGWLAGRQGGCGRGKMGVGVASVTVLCRRWMKSHPWCAAWSSCLGG